MIVGIVGLGLIGGSFAKAYHESGHTVLAYDTNTTILDYAKMCGVVNDTLDEHNISECDIVLIAVYPNAAIEYFKQMAPHIGKNTVVLDCCGTKRGVCQGCFPVAREYGISFAGGHPMAGTHNSGFKYARANLFHNAPMVIVPMDRNDIALLSRIQALLAPAGFASFSVTSADEHDTVIAFTSQLAHLASNAYIKSPTAKGHKGISAGSYKDMTRVAWLDPNMWAELFLENSDKLTSELDSYINSLCEYRKALAAHDKQALIALLDEGRRLKEEVDGR